MSRRLMATTFEIFLPGSDRPRLQAAAEEALDEIERVEAQLSAYRWESELSGINARAAEEPVRVEPRLLSLLQEAGRISRVTGGAFDMAVGSLLHCWGISGGDASPPDDDALRVALASSGWRNVQLDARHSSVQFRCRGLLLDPGAIGKGYGIDRAVTHLRDAGVEEALLHSGTSTVYGLGGGPDGCGWPVAIRGPRSDEDRVAVIRLRNRALSVSAPHGKAIQGHGRTWGHLIDPRTGSPVPGAAVAAVADDRATVADAVSTALLVLGLRGVAGLHRRLPECGLLTAEMRGSSLEVAYAGPDEWEVAE